MSSPAPIQTIPVPYISPPPPASAKTSAEYNDRRVLRPGEARSLLAGSTWNRFAVVGDSLAEGRGDETLGYLTLSWADRIAAELEVERYVNLGERHLTSSEVLGSQVERVIDWHPDLVAVIAGGNDVLVADPDLAQTERALDATYSQLLATGADVVAFTLMDPSPLLGNPTLGQRLGALNSVIRNTALKNGVIVADLAARPYAADRTIYSGDLMHPNMRGHAVIASSVIESLTELIRNRQGLL
jgi:lysophospholipase L1-like esterase